MSNNPYEGMTGNFSGAMKGANLKDGEYNRQSTQTSKGPGSGGTYSKSDMSRASMSPDQMGWQEYLGLALWGFLDEGNYEGFFRLCGLYEGALDDALEGLSRLLGVGQEQNSPPPNVENFPQPMPAAA